jgi:hypothetical protein
MKMTTTQLTYHYMIRRYALLLSLMWGVILTLPAQTIQLHFPYFAGVPYTWLLFQGDRQDTLVNGVIPANGKVDLVMPDRHRGYVGMTRWILTSQQGGGLDLIVNESDYRVVCLEPAPSRENIQFVGNSETPYLNEQYYLQQDLLMKAEAIRVALESYSEGDPFFTSLQQEMARLKEAFLNHQIAVAQHPSYAARFRQIVDLTRGVADQLYDDDMERARALDRFVTREMDWGALYTSNHWGGVISNWVEMHVYAIDDDAVLLAGTRAILSRITDPKIYTDFAIQLVRHFTRYDKDHLLSELSSEVNNSGKLLHNRGALMVFAGLHKGDKAVVPVGLTNTRNIYRNGAVVFFYETECGNCIRAKNHLTESYPTLSKHSIRVISISADKEAATHQSTVASLPWPDKIGDYIGRDGENFNTWGVLGTPTVFLIGRDGTILGRYVHLSLEDILKELGINDR